MKSICLLSGGLDSTVLLAWMRNHVGGEIFALSFDYGQRHRRELWSAFQIAHYYGAADLRLRISPELLAGSSLTSVNTPVSEPLAGPLTVVPGRNLIFTALAVAEAVRRGAEAVYLAPNRDDHALYPDCRPEFVNPLNIAAQVGYGVRIAAPFAALSKQEIVQQGRELAVPFDMTWSCYDPQGWHESAPASGRQCGVCGACKVREEALS